MVSVTTGSQHHHQPPSWPTSFCCFVLFFFSQGKQQNFNDSLAKRRYKQRSRRAAAAACDVACVEKCCLVWTRRAYSHWSMLPSAVLPSCKHRSHTQVVITGSEEWDNNTKTQQHTTLHSFFFQSFFFFRFLQLPHFFSFPHRFAESSGTKYELTDGNGMTGVERRASEGASEGGFIYSGKRRRGRALQRRSQPSIPLADRKHVCSKTLGRAGRRLCSFVII